MKEKKCPKARQWLAIALFLALTCLPPLLWLLVRAELTGENTENRNLTEFPALSAETLSSFPQNFEAWLNDHLPFRDQLIRWNSAIRYYMFNSSMNSNVVLGKNGWLFYAAENNLAFYTGEKLYSEEELALICDNLQHTKDALAEKGIRFVLMVAPNKERMYAEYMPDSYGSPANECALFQVMQAVEERTSVKLVCPYETLMMEEAENPDRLLYHPTDTHWNSWGAYLGTRDLLDALWVDWDEESLAVTVEPDTAGDLADMLNLAGVINPGMQTSVTGYQLPETQMTEYDFFGDIRFTCPARDNGKLLMCRDSFCSAMAPVLGHAFTECCLRHINGFSPEQIDAEAPDYFVYEIVERSLDTLLTFRY